MHCAMRAFPLLPCTEIPTGQTESASQPELHACSPAELSTTSVQQQSRERSACTHIVVGQRCTVVFHVRVLFRDVYSFFQNMHLSAVYGIELPIPFSCVLVPMYIVHIHFQNFITSNFMLPYWNIFRGHSQIT